MIWQEYYNQAQKEIVLKLREDAIIEYGDVIYQSPEIDHTRWLVTSFRGEYNVFVEHIACNGKCERNLGASFSWKERAMEFALEMFLVCSGQLKRKDRHHDK